MSAERVRRALERLLSPGAHLAKLNRGSGYGVQASADRRRRAVGRLSAGEVRDLEASGTVETRTDGALVLSAAGRARVRRDASHEDDAFLAQHARVVLRAVADADGGLRSVSAVEEGSPLRRLAALRCGNGAPWLSSEELAAADRLRRDCAAAQVGLVRGSDWRAPPRGSAPRGNGEDARMAARCDARRRMDDGLNGLAAPLRRVVERVCLHDDGLEVLERAEGWPARSGKLALKLGLAQLARR